MDKKKEKEGIARRRKHGKLDVVCHRTPSTRIIYPQHLIMSASSIKLPSMYAYV